jgi:ABC-type amino acid transport substrate-binding protein
MKIQLLSRFLWVLLTAGLLFSLFGCGQASPETAAVGTQGKSNEESINAAASVELLNGKVLGGITRIVSEKESEQIYEAQYKKEYNLDLDLAGMLYADNIDDGLALLRSHQIVGFEILGVTAHYIVQRNPDLKMYVQEFRPSTVHMLFDVNKKEPCERVNTAIKAMLAEGSTDRLKAQWIDNLPAEPSYVPIPIIPRAGNFKVGVTGGEPPLDYTAADGRPTGYSLAVLSEVCKRANLNVALVTINTSDRFTALQSGTIGAFLWKTEMKSIAAYHEDPTFDDIDPAKYLMSYPYLETSRAIIVLK